MAQTVQIRSEARGDKGIIRDGLSGEILHNGWRNLTKKSVTKALSTGDRIHLTEHSVPYLSSAACNLSALDVVSFDVLDAAIKSAGVRQGSSFRL